MVAIFTGSGTGLERGSGNIIGASGLLGSAGLGRGGEQLFLNAGNGNLVVNHRDEFLSGRGGDVAISRTYNSLGNFTDDNGDNWRQSTDRRVYGLSGAANTTGSFVFRRSGDGSEIAYSWNGSAYVATDGAGAHDKLTYNANQWTWTDGDSRVTEVYSAYSSEWRIASESDTSGNSLSYSYSGANLIQITTADGGYVQYGWSGNNIVSVVTSSQGASLTRTRYSYDSVGRLSTVIVDLSPDDNSVADNNVYTTTYTYVGTTKLVASISETDGSSVSIGYDGSNRVISVSQQVATGVVRVTSLTYSLGFTEITDPSGQVTRIDYQASSVRTVGQPLESWPSTATATASGTIDGMPAIKLATKAAGNPVYISTLALTQAGFTVAAGETVSFTLSLQAEGAWTSQVLALFSDIATTGANADSYARIVSGPGTVTRSAYQGASFVVDGLSTTQATRVEIVRTYRANSIAGAAIIVDGAQGSRAGSVARVAGATLKASATGSQAIQITSPAPGGTGATQVQHFALDQYGNVISMTDAAGQGTIFSYDGAGNVLTQTDKLGNTVTRTYNAANKMLTETQTGSDKDSAAAAHTTRYVYDAAARLRFIVSPEGQVVEYRYNTYGQLVLSVEAEGRLYNLAGLSDNAALSETTLVNWMATAPDISAVKYIEYAYDARGNLVQQINYGASTGGTAQTSAGYTHQYFVYDQAGQLLSSAPAGRNLEHYLYDGLGRIVAKTDVNGGTTSFVFNDAAIQTVVTLANGFIQTSTYNKAGELIGTTESGAFTTTGTASYKYDKNGRVRTMTDATGVNSYYLYDKVGRRVADINESGWATEYRYDANDRLVAAVHYALGVSGGASTMAALADPNSTIEFAAIRPVAHANDIWSWTVYDAEGRTVEAIDGDGSVTAYAYDAAGQRIKTTAYVNKLTAAQIASFRSAVPASPVLPGAHADDSVARVFYDKDGNVLGALDGEGFLTRVLYDAAGQKVQEIAYANAINATLRASGTLQQLVDSAGASAANRSLRSVYDKQGLLRFTIDGTGHVTEFRYGYDSVPWLAFGPVRQTIEYAGTLGALSSYSFDSVGAAVAPLAANGDNRLSFAIYDDAGRLAYSIDATGEIVGFSYDSLGQLIKKVEYATLRVTSALPDKATLDSWAASSASGADRVTRYYHDGRGDLRFTVDAEGYVTRTDYDAEGRVTWEGKWDTPLSLTDQSTINDANYTANWSDYSSKAFSYDGNGRLAVAYSQEGLATYYYYAANGVLALEVRSAGQIDESRTQYDYDAAGRMVVRYDAVGTASLTSTSYGYDGRGSLLSRADGLNHATTYAYDHRGLKISATDALGGVTRFEYNAFGDLVKTTDALGNARYRYYDQLGRIVATRDAEDYVTETGYTAFGEVASIKVYFNKATNAASPTAIPSGNGANSQDATTQFTYDKIGRVVTTTDAAGFVEKSWYDAFGNITQTQNKLGALVHYTYDRRGLVLTEAVDAPVYNTAGTQIASAYYRNVYEYDARGNMVHRVEGFNLPERRDTWFGYDRVGRLITKTGATRGVLGASNHIDAAPVESYKYDTRGNLIQTTDANGARTLFYYDALDRKIAELNAVGTLSTFSYDAAANLKASVTYAGTVALPATAGGTPPAVPAGEFRQTSYAYDNLNRLTSTSISGVRTGAWNGAAFVLSTAAITTSVAYDAVGNVTSSTDANGGVTRNRYDKVGNKTRTIDGEGYITGWLHDAEGNVYSERRWALKATSGDGDPATTVDDRVTNFAYDKMGRRITEERVGVVASVISGSGVRTDNNGSSFVFYSYDALGNVTRKTEATGDSADYEYDAYGRLLREQRAGIVDYTGAAVRPTIGYYYNSLGDLVRTAQTGGSASDRVTTYNYYKDGRLYSTVDPTGAVTEYYYDASGNLLRQNYGRAKSDGSIAYEGILFTRDALGRVTSQTIGVWNGSAWTKGDSQQTQYNAYGDVAQRGINNGWQEQFAYDGAGRLYRSNAGDGVWRFYVYDAKGNQTAVIESEGTAIGGKTLEQMLSDATIGFANGLGQLYIDGINVTINVFDARGQATASRLARRQLSATGAVTDLVTSRSYNAFGEMVTETDARGYQTNYGYNAMGRTRYVQHAAVSITSATGAVSTVNPTEYYYYDLSGRLVAQDDANGNRTTRALLAGTGYGATPALVSWEWHADGGIVKNGYDRFGDLRRVTDEINRTTAMDYDAMGRLTQIVRPDAAAEYYAYDVLGQRIKHWNSFYGNANVETTDYDQQGRVVRTQAFGGDVTTTTYNWSANMATSGLGTFGGWVETTTYANARTSVKQADLFDHITASVDLGDHASSYSYDLAGRMVSRAIAVGSGESSSYAWLNTGLVGTVTTTTLSVIAGQVVTAANVTAVQSSTYDANGNKLTEYGTRNGVVIQNATSSYDALGRIATWSEAGSAATPAASVSWKYDANGNIRNQATTFAYLDGNGAAGSTGSTSWWYRYDAMNRVVTDHGVLSNGSIVRGSSGVDLSYDAAGQRHSVLIDKYLTGLASVWVWYPDYDPANHHLPSPMDPGMTGDYQLQERGYYGLSQEIYSYDGAGNLTSAAITVSGYTDNDNGTVSSTGVVDRAIGGGTFTYDLLGHQTHQVDRVEGGVVLYDHSQSWDAKGRAYLDTVYQKQGSDLVTTQTLNSFSDGTANYALGAITSSTTTGYRYVNGYTYQASPTTTTTTRHSWFDGAVQDRVEYTAAGSATQSTDYTNTLTGTLVSASVHDGRARTITVTSDALGQAIKRDEADSNPWNATTLKGGDPHEVWYRFNGRQIGYTGNDGSWDNSYTGSLEDRTHTVWGGEGAFRYGMLLGMSYADFNDRLTPINTYSQGSSGGSYTVRGGESLSSIAAQLWGDASLWYELAAANGLSSDAAPPAGSMLTVPSGIVRNTNSASTFKPYNPADAYGDTSPTTPKPQAAKKNKCGVFGQILLVAVAVAVSAVTYGALSSALGPVAAGAVSGAAGSIASQTVGVATGIQDKFSFKGVAISAIAGGVGAGLGSVKALRQIAGSPLLGNVVRGALGSAATQGIGVAVGLQTKFDWVGVAAAGIGAGIGGAVASALHVESFSTNSSISNIANSALAGAAGAIADAATRSLLEGSDFGDNLLAALPNAVGQTIGQLAAEGASRIGRDGGMSPGEMAFLSEAEKSANAVPAAESNRIYQAQLANEARAAAEVEQAAANVEFGDIVVTAQLHDAVYRPGVDLPLLSQIGGGGSSRNPRVRIGGNGGPPLEDWRTLRQIGVPQVNGPTGAIFGVLDNLFDLTGPALEMQSEFLDLWTKNNISDILAIDPGHNFPSRLVASGPEGESIRWKTANYNFYESELAATKYIYQGDIGALQNETLRVYQGFVDQGFAQALAEAKAGTLFQPQGWSRPQALGTRMDDLARGNMERWFTEHRINPGLDVNVTVNSRLAAQPEGSYTIPDIRVGGVVFDASIARKDINTFQVKQFYTSPKVQSVFIVRPTSMGGSYFLPKSGNR